MLPWLLTGLACLTDSPPPSASSEPAPVPEPALILSLDRTDMTTPAGVLHGGAVPSFHQQTVATVSLGPGDHDLSVLASVTDVDGAPGQLDVHLGESAVARLSVPPGGLQWVTARFSLPAAHRAPLPLSFVNDHYAEDADRNITLDRLRLTRISAPTPAERARQLRAQLAGSNLILISLDTLRPDHLSAYGYPRHTSPSIDRLAASGVRFDAATAASHWTAPSHATMLTGLHPAEHGVVSKDSAMSPEITTIAEHLQAAGYATGGFTGSYFVTRLLGLDQGFSTWREQPGPCSEGFAEAIDWMTAQTEPFFLFAHTYQTHAPYDPPAPYERMFTPDGPLPPRSVGEQFRGPGAPPTPAELDALIGLYDGEIRAADHCVGMLMTALGERSADTLVVLTSDHGEEFMEYGGFGHRRLLPVLLRVPLILSHPLLRTTADAHIATPTGAVDLVPTLLDMLGIDATIDASGQSLVAVMTGTERIDPAAFSSSGEHGERAALRDADGHFIRLPDAEHLFIDDPLLGEHDALHRASTAELTAYRDQLEATEQQLRPRAPAEPTVFSDERLEALRALGYIDELSE